MCYIWVYNYSNMKRKQSLLKAAVIAAEYNQILIALEKCHFNKSRAAEHLGIDRKTIYNKINAMAKLGIK